MQISISTYQTQRGTRCSITTVCAGLFAWNIHSGDVGKARQRVIERLRKEVPKLERHEVSRLFVPLGRKLERLRLDLTLEDGGDKKHVAGVFPVVVEPRHTGREEPLRIAYHPLRPADWFEIEGSSPTPQEVARNYSRIFGPADDIDEIKGNGQDKLVTLRLDVDPPSIFKLLPSARQKPEFAGAGRSGDLDALFRVAVNQTARAANGHLHPGLPRARERLVMQQLLSGPQKKPVLVVGPPGSGKSTLIAQAVLDLLEADNYASHGNLDRVHNVMQLRGRQIIAGMSYVGQWGARCVELLARAKKRKLVFWTDDIHAWGSIGKTTVSDRVLADFFRGPLARGELVIIGECTREQLSLLEHEAPAFAATFARLILEPATTEQTLSMLVHESRRLEQEHEIAFDPHGFRTILDLSASLSGGTSLPGRALAPLKAIAKLQVQAAQQAEDDETPDVGPAQVLALFAKQTGLPEALLSSAVPLDRAELFRELGQQILGQNAALEAASDLVLAIRAKTCAPGRPYGVFLFTGPTGTGKTELAKCVADYLYGSPERLVRFDMGEFNTFDAPGRLIGDTWNPEGQLTSAVRAQPFCVLLFDEIEKAHPSALNLMLQIFEDARLTDARGSVVDFAHCVIVMTSNLGSASRGVRGFLDAPSRASAETAKAVRDFFPPELFNRIDRVVAFEPLDRTTAKGIVRKELARLVARPGVSERSTFVRFTEAVVERVVEAGYSAEYGARALKRYIDREVGDRLTHAIVDQPRAEMRLLWLHLDPRGGVGVRAEALAEAEPYGQTSAMEPLLRRDHESLRRLVPRVLGALRDFEGDGRLRALADQLSRELSAYRLGDEGRADQLFTLDALLTDVRKLTRRLESRVQTDADLQELERHRKRAEGIPLAGDDYTTLGADFGRSRDPDRPPAPDRPVAANPSKATRQLLSDFARVMSFERLLTRVDQTDRHVALVEVLRVTAHHERRRFSKGSPGLLEWLAQAYATGRRSLDAAAVTLEDGTVQPASGPELASLFEQRPRYVALRLVGPGVTDFLANETGCQIRRTLAAGPEIVRVHVEPGHHDPLARAREHTERVRAFEAGLEGTGPMVENPEALLPVTRVFHFDPPPDGSVLARVEDYRFAYVVSRRVRHLRNLLDDLWLLAAGRDVSNATWNLEGGAE